MINLLPQEEKKQLVAARGNSLLVRYNILLVGVAVFLALAIGFVYIYLTNTQSVAEDTIAENNLKVASYSDVSQQASQFRSNLSTAKQILDREVTYSDTIIEIAQALPSGVVLNSLSLDADTFGTEKTITAQASSYQRALALKNSLQNSSLFSNVHFQSITTGSGDAESSDYPVSVTVSVIINNQEDGSNVQTSRP